MDESLLRSMSASTRPGGNLARISDARKNEPVMQIRSSGVAMRRTAFQASAGVAMISIVGAAAQPPAPLPKGEGRLRRQRQKLLRRDAAGIVRVAGENHVVEPAEQLLQHAAMVLFLRRGENQQPPVGRKALVEHFDQGGDRGDVVGGIEHHGRPPGNDFHPRRPDDFGQSAANCGLGDRPALSPQLFYRRQRHRRVGRLMAAQQTQRDIGSNSRGPTARGAYRPFLRGPLAPGYSLHLLMLGITGQVSEIKLCRRWPSLQMTRRVVIETEIDAQFHEPAAVLPGDASDHFPRFFRIDAADDRHARLDDAGLLGGDGRSVSPNCLVWSKLMLVMIDTQGEQTLVESSRPPSPTSSTAASTRRRRNDRTPSP